MLDAIIFFP